MTSPNVPPPPRIFRALARGTCLTLIALFAATYAITAPETRAQTAPSAPQSLTATGACTAGQVDLTWTAPATGTASKYQTRHKASSASWPASGGWSDITPATATAASITTATDGSTYDIQVRAVDTSGSSPVNGTSASTTATAFRVSCPVADQSFAGATIGSLRTSWATPDPAGLTRTRFEYRYKVNTAANYPTSGAGSWATVSGGANAKHVDITGLSSRNWNVQIRAVADDSGTDVYSRIETTERARAYLNPVTNLTATTGTQPGEVVLSWTNPSSSNGNKIALWRISDRVTHRTSAGGDLSDGSVQRGYTYLGGNSVNQTTTTLTVDPGTTYEFAIYNTGFIGASGLATAQGTGQTVPTPDEPNISPTTAGYGQATVSWDYPQPAAVLLDGFQYQSRSQGEISWPATWTNATAPANDPNVPGTEWDATISGTPGETVEARIRSAITIARTGAGGQSTHYSQPVMATGQLSLAPAPKDLTAQPGQTIGEIQVTWSIPDGQPIPPAAIAGYRIRSKQSDQEQYTEWTDLSADAVSHTFTVTSRKQHDIQVQIIIDTDGDLVTTTADIIYSEIAEASGKPNAPTGPLPKPEGLTADTTKDSATLTWNEPSDDNVTGFQYRWRNASSNAWSRWIDTEVTNQDSENPNEPQTATIRNLAFETTYIFELRSTADGDYSESITVSATTSIGIPRINRIEPAVRTVNITANSSIRLSVNIYDRQDGLANSDADNSTESFAGISTTFAWSEPNGNGSFHTPNNGRSVLYTAPNQPGTYTITAAATPDGICTGHHENPPNNEDCTATFTLRVTRATTIPTETDPVNPAGLIPDAISDQAGNEYTVFTPAGGGTFSVNDQSRITVTAHPGAVPDNTFIAIRAEHIHPADFSGPRTSAPRLNIDGNYARITAVDERGNPLENYRLNKPAQVCLPMPNQFRDRLDAVTIVQLQHDGSNSPTVLTSRVFTAPPNGLRICAAISVIPATIAPARFGIQPSPTPVPAPTIGNIETGATNPNLLWLIAATLIVASAAIAFRFAKRST